MPFQVIHTDPWDSMTVGKPFGKRETHQQRSHQAWTLGDGHAVDLVSRDAGLSDSTVDDGNDGLDMFSGGQLRHHAAIRVMDGHLGGHYGGEHLMAVAHHCRRRFVAG